jgi:radical SAM protein with 4Fe4S-binding SPASM domain
MAPYLVRDRIRSLRGQPGVRALLAAHRVLPLGAVRWPVILDVTRGCNLGCLFCTNSPRTRRAAADLALLEVLAGEVLPHAAEVALGCRHEPLLHPALASWLEGLGRARARLTDPPFLVLLTSGTLLGPGTDEILAGGGLDLVLFSVDTTDPEGLARLRPPTRWPDLRARFQRFLPLAAAAGTKVGVQGLILAETLPHLAATVATLADLGVRIFSLSQMVTDPRPGRLHPLLHDGGRHAALVRELEAVARLGRERRLELLLPEALPPAVPGDLFPVLTDGAVWDEHRAGAAGRPAVCTAPWTKVRVDHEGYVFPCPQMTRAAEAWGRLGAASFAEIVNGPVALGMRDALLAGEAPCRTCARCPFGPGPQAGCR